MNYFRKNAGLIVLLLAVAMCGCAKNSSVDAEQTTEPLLKTEKIFTEETGDVPGQIIEYQYDESGRKTLVTNKWLSEDGDGNYVTVSTSEYSYNDDGSYNETVDYSINNEKHVYSYDDKGRQVYESSDYKGAHAEYKISYEDGGEKNVEKSKTKTVESDFYFTEEKACNEYGDEISWRQNSSDGDVAEIIYDYEYDDRGNKLTCKRTGEIEDYTEYEYDADSRLIKETVKDESNGINSVTTTEYHYDEKGILTEETETRTEANSFKPEDTKKTVRRIEYEYYESDTK